MATDRYDNDPAIRVTADGGDLDYSGGQPRMDRGGLENAVIISLFSAEGWVGNALETDPDRMVGSDFLKGQGAPITSQTIRDMELAGKRALAWMINVGIASEAIVRVSAPKYKRIHIEVDVLQIDNITAYFKYDLNWSASIQQPVINTGV
jgi:phage gp46-like protein